MTGQSNRGYWLPIAIATAFLAVALFAIVTYVNTSKIRESEQVVARSYAIREATEKLLAAMRDTETGQRGFLLTGDEAFLEPYDRGTAEAQNQFDALYELVAPNSEITKYLEQLRASFALQQRHLRETIELRRAQPNARVSDQLLELVKSGRGRVAMNSARQTANQIVAYQTELLKNAEAINKNLTSVTRTTITVGNVIALGLILATAFAAKLDRKKRDAAEQALVAEQAELAAVVDSAYEGIITRDQKYRIRLINPAAAKLLGVDASLAIGRSLLDFIPEDCREAMKMHAALLHESNEQVLEFNNQIMQRDNGTRFTVSGNTVRTQTATEDLVTVKFRDISEVQNSQIRQREYTAILEQINDAVLVCDLDGKVRSCNDSAEALFAISEGEMVGKHSRELLGIDHAIWDQQRNQLLETGYVGSQLAWISPKGCEYVLEQRRSLIRDESGTPIGKLLFLIDITDRVREEAKERRTQRLESIGTLAGGIAHDLNNVLTPIVMSAKLLKRGSKTPERLVDHIIASADRGGRMIKKLLAYAVGDDSQRTQVDLREILTELEEMLGHTLQHSIELRLDVPDQLRTVDADSTELSQVIMNLVINARDSMPSGGRIEIKVENVDIDESKDRISDELKAGSYVRLTVSDNGQGIPKEILHRIFDPFFTTKAQGKGTGLGLATSLGIVRSYGGDITVQSDVDVGSQFSVYLPASQLVREPGQSTDHEDLPIGNGETVLIVDDESLILETTRESLESNQYKTLTAKSGTEAIAIYQRHRSPIDIVLLDMMMPGMDGSEIKDAIRILDPKARIIASSGLRRPGQEGCRWSDVEGFLAKPYTDEQLLRLIRQVIDQPQRTPL